MKKENSKPWLGLPNWSPFFGLANTIWNCLSGFGALLWRISTVIGWSLSPGPKYISCWFQIKKDWSETPLLQ